MKATILKQNLVGPDAFSPKQLAAAPRGKHRRAELLPVQRVQAEAPDVVQLAPAACLPAKDHKLVGSAVARGELGRGEEEAGQRAEPADGQLAPLPRGQIEQPAIANGPGGRAAGACAAVRERWGGDGVGTAC